MDRNDNWNRIKKAYDLLTLGQGKKEKSALETIQKSYDSNVTDEFIEPTLIDDGKGEVGVINKSTSEKTFSKS